MSSNKTRTKLFRARQVQVKALTRSDSGLELRRVVELPRDVLLDERNPALAARLVHGARLVRYAPPEIVFSGTRPIAADTLTELAQVLKGGFGHAWKLSMLDAPGEPTLKEAADAARDAEREAVLASPLVRAALDAFPDAELESWTSQRSVS